MTEGNHLDRSITRGFRFAIVLTAVTLVAEVAGGFWTNSLALLSDALHNLSDTTSLGVSLAAMRISRRQPDVKRTFGYRRAHQRSLRPTLDNRQYHQSVQRDDRSFDRDRRRRFR